MASTMTLTSLAMLKVNLDKRRDYLDYLNPFVQQVLVDDRPDPVTDQVVRDGVRQHFGLEIPAQVIQTVLKRNYRSWSMTREYGVYHIAGDLPNPGLGAGKAAAQRHIDAVVNGLTAYAAAAGHPFYDDEKAVATVLEFLSEFSLSCLRAYLGRTAIPGAVAGPRTRIVLMSDYVLHLQTAEPERFESLMVLIQGHMLANALLCPDLSHAPKTYKEVAFYFDTPVLIQALGLDGDPGKQAFDELKTQLVQLGGKVAAFAHSKNELSRVLTAVADSVESRDGWGPMVLEARRRGTTRSDFLLMATQLDDLLASAGVEVLETPPYVAPLQIDEVVLGKTLLEEVNHFNPRAAEDDINSVRSIYVLRGKRAPTTLEKSCAVLVSSNADFAEAAWIYGQKHEASREVSAVITDFSLANMVWLKSPMGAPSIPRLELLAFAYAALEPPRGFMEKVLIEVDKLEQRGTISERDHQLLRSSTVAQDQLMRLTLGDEAALTDENVTEALARVSDKIRADEHRQVLAEQASLQEARSQLAAIALDRDRLRSAAYRRCERNANRCSQAVELVLTAFAAIGLFGGLGLGLQGFAPGVVVFFTTASLALLSFINLRVGTTIRDIRNSMQLRLLAAFLRREEEWSRPDAGTAG